MTDPQIPNPLITRLPTNPSTFTQPAPVFGRLIPQLDGGSYQEATQCTTCMKILETEDDIKWHYKTKIGREDCSILKSMLGWQPD